jgi:hypothetical protein
MTIDGVSQTTWAERLVEVGASDASLLMVIRDGDDELGRALLPTEEMMTVLTDRPAGPHEVGEPMLLIEVRRNEVLLSIGGADAAVGLDDLTDAVAGVLP